VATPKLLLTALAGALFVTSCSASAASPTGACGPDRLATKERGTLTLSTGVITRAPWVVGPQEQGRSADPHHGQGYDAAVGYTLAERLGFDRADVKWVATPFADALREGQKPFDVNVNQVTIRADRDAAVDLSRPYYRARLAVVALKGSPVLRDTSLDDLRGRTFAVVRGSAAASAAGEVLPSAAVTAYPDLEEVRRAVSMGARDALVVDYLTALRLDADETQLVDGAMAGVLPSLLADGEQFGLVLEKGSALTACVDEALAGMESDGTLRSLEQRWLVDEPGWRWFEQP
jgi:polar amino acid transport system substrate-binding protein